MNWGLDWELWIRIGKRFPFTYTDKILAASRIYSDTKTATGGFKRMREIVKILNRHDVNIFSPAVISHAIITTVRKFCNNAELITPEIMTASVPGPMQKIATPIIERIERSLRRWLQNVQGIWQDGFIGEHGKLWLPSDGQKCILEINGKNLRLTGQQIRLRAAGKVVSTHNLSPEEFFTLKLRIPAGNIPVRAELFCSRTVNVQPLDPRYGPRLAGCLLENFRLVTA